MMKALYSGVSGMRSHQTKMDVIGNNIANVNTNGYKTQRATFRDIYYQTISSPNAGVAGTSGGTNSSQIGYGAQVGSVDTIHTLSGYSPTNKATDLYINGDGYLIVQNAATEKFYTRYGALNFDAVGNLVDSKGSMVMGLNKANLSKMSADGVVSEADLEAITVDLANYSNITINADGTITGLGLAGTDKDNIITLGQLAIAYVPNQNALVLDGNSYYKKSNNTGSITYHEAGLKGTGGIVSGGLEMSNVDLANEFSEMIVTQRGFQANTKIISVVDQMLEELVNLKR